MIKKAPVAVFLSDKLPFNIIQTIELPKNTTFRPSKDMRETINQNKDSFLVTGNWTFRNSQECKLCKFTRDSKGWFIENKEINLSVNAAIESFVLPNGNVLITAHDAMSIVSDELKHVQDFKLGDLVSGLSHIVSFIHLVHRETVSFMMLVSIANLEEIEAMKILHSNEKPKTPGIRNKLLTELDLTWNGSTPEIKIKSVTKNSTILYQFEDASIIELGKNKQLVNDLLIDAFNVTRKLAGLA